MTTPGQSPHWGYMISGELVVIYTDGTEETCDGNDLFGPRAQLIPANIER